MKFFSTIYVLFFCLLPWCGWGQTPATGNTSSIADVQTQAYLAVSNADQAMEASAWEDAIRFYTTALKAYQRIKELDPLYQQRTIDFRISYCTNKIKELQVKLNAAPPPEILAAQSELREMKMKYAALQADAEAMRNLVAQLQKREMDIGQQVRETMLREASMKKEVDQKTEESRELQGLLASRQAELEKVRSENTQLVTARKADADAMEKRTVALITDLQAMENKMKDVVELEALSSAEALEAKQALEKAQQEKVVLESRILEMKTQAVLAVENARKAWLSEQTGVTNALQKELEVSRTALKQMEAVTLENANLKEDLKAVAAQMELLQKQSESWVNWQETKQALEEKLAQSEADRKRLEDTMTVSEKGLLEMENLQKQMANDAARFAQSEKELKQKINELTSAYGALEKSKFELEDAAARSLEIKAEKYSATLEAMEAMAATHEKIVRERDRLLQLHAEDEMMRREASQQDRTTEQLKLEVERRGESIQAMDLKLAEKEQEVKRWREESEALRLAANALQDELIRLKNEPSTEANRP